jgi:hypothetical protein
VTKRVTFTTEFASGEEADSIDLAEAAGAGAGEGAGAGKMRQQFTAELAPEESSIMLLETEEFDWELAGYHLDDNGTDCDDAAECASYPHGEAEGFENNNCTNNTQTAFRTRSLAAATAAATAAAAAAAAAAAVVPIHQPQKHAIVAATSRGASKKSKRGPTPRF